MTITTKRISKELKEYNRATRAMGKRNGRPPLYNKKMGNEICRRLMDGESLNSICRDKHMPGKVTVYYWLKDPRFADFLAMYNVAREVQADSIVDQMIDISDDSQNDYIDREGIAVLDQEAIARTRVRLDTRKWVAGRLNATKYGDKQTNVLEGGEKPILTEPSTRDVAKAVALVMAKGLKNTVGGNGDKGGSGKEGGE